MLFDLHVHTKYSFDSLMGPRRVLKMAKRKGLDGIAITDHNSIQGGLEVRECNKDNLLVIVGCEVSTEIGDLIGLFLEQDIRSRTSTDVIAEIREQNGLVVLSHPFRGHKLSDEFLVALDAVEGFNARSTPEENARALELAQRCGLPVTGGSDAHWPTEIGLGGLVVNDSIGNVDALREAIVKGRGTLYGCYAPSLPKILSKLIKPYKLGQICQYPRLALYLWALCLRAIWKKVGRHS